MTDLSFGVVKWRLISRHSCRVQMPFVPRTGGVCARKGRQPFLWQIVSVVGFCRTYSAPFRGTSYTQRVALGWLCFPLCYFAPQSERSFQSLFEKVPSTIVLRVRLTYYVLTALIPYITPSFYDIYVILQCYFLGACIALHAIIII